MHPEQSAQDTFIRTTALKIQHSYNQSATKHTVDTFKMSFVSTFLRRTATRTANSRIPAVVARLQPFSSSSSEDNRNTSLKSDVSHDDDDSSLIVSQFKNQIVHQLWTARAKAKKDKTMQPVGGSSTCVQVTNGKTSCQSETKVEYPFTSDAFLAESYRSPWNTMRLGKVFEDLDALGRCNDCCC